MRALQYSSFNGPVTIEEMPRPVPEDPDALVEVRRSGLCRSDFRAWTGGDADVVLPCVPGHEFTGIVRASASTPALVGRRVVVPFVMACGDCPECQRGNAQVCRYQRQPGFTDQGSFAEYVLVPRARVNLVPLPDAISDDAAASLGCRFVTSFRAVVDQGKVTGGQWVAVHGCGGVGLSAIMIANALGANVVAVDISDDKLKLAREVGAAVTINARAQPDVVAAVRDATGGGAHVSLDALGHPQTCFNSVANLRKRGKHIQVGLLLAEQATPPIPMAQVIAHELEILGSHGMQAHRYGAMLDMISAGKLTPQQLVGRRIDLAESIPALMAMDRFEGTGVTIIDRF